jgi:prepilin peptidase CpaA
VDKSFLIIAAVLASVGAATDVRTRRIPNWLTYSGTVAALLARVGRSGWSGLETGLAGALVAGTAFCVVFLVGGMGGGDVKLMAGVGAWLGPAHALVTLIATSIAGGILALAYVVISRRFGRTVMNVLKLARHRLTSGLRPHPRLNVRERETVRVPYGVAIAMGTFYCAGYVFWWR